MSTSRTMSSEKWRRSKTFRFEVSLIHVQTADQLQEPLFAESCVFQSRLYQASEKTARINTNIRNKDLKEAQELMEAAEKALVELFTVQPRLNIFTGSKNSNVLKHFAEEVLDVGCACLLWSYPPQQDLCPVFESENSCLVCLLFLMFSLERVCLLCRKI